MKNAERNWNRIARMVAMALALGLVFVGSSPAVAAPPSAAPAAVSREIPSASSAPAATPSELAGYVSRDKKASKELREFAGGDTIVIGATTAVIVILLVVLLIVLLR